MKHNIYHFKQQDECGRVIELECYSAENFKEAENQAYAVAEKIHSSGVTYCDARGNALPIPTSEYTANIHIKYASDKKKIEK